MTLQSLAIRPPRSAIGLAVLGLALLTGFGDGLARGEDKKPTPCNEDAMIVFDASGSMSGNQTLGIPNSEARIDQVRSALAEVLPSATKFRKVGLITYGPGPYNQCNVKLELKPAPCAGEPIMNAAERAVSPPARRRSPRRSSRRPTCSTTPTSPRYRGGDRRLGPAAAAVS